MMNRIDSLFLEDMKLSESLDMASGDDGTDAFFSVNEAREADKIHLFENSTEDEYNDDVEDDDGFADFIMGTE